MSRSDAIAIPGVATNDRLRPIVEPEAQGGARPGYIGVADAIRVLRRRWRLVLAVMVGGVVLAMVVIAQTTPVYSTSATVMVQQPDREFSVLTPTSLVGPNEETAIETKVELFQSRSLAREAAHTLRLDDDPEFAPDRSRKESPMRRLATWLVPPPTLKDQADARSEEAVRANREAVVDGLVSRLDVARVARSRLVSVTASSQDPAKAARIANRVVDTYLRAQIDDAREGREATIRSLAQRVAQVREHLQAADIAVSDYRGRNGLLNSRPEDIAVMQVGQLGGMAAQARADGAADVRRAAVGGRLDGSISATSALLGDLRQQDALLRRRLAELTTFYGPGYADVVKARAELTVLEDRIAQETRRITADLRQQAAASQSRAATIGAGIGAIRAESFKAGVDAVPLRALERKAEAANTLYVSLLNQLNAEIGSPADRDPDIKIVSRAPIPEYPSSPVPGRALAVAVPASLALGILLAFVMEGMDTKMRTADQVRRILGLPTLAMVPDMSGENAGERPAHALVGLRPRSRFAEAMRNLLIELESRKGTTGSHVVVITSPLEGEGKNMIATSLAAAAAIVGRNAVVVDFDLRRPDPAMGGISGPSGIGVVAFLSGDARLDDIEVGQDDAHFATIGVGAAPIDPGALIASPRLPALLQQLRERYDLVILNAPPILPVRDAKTLADVADSTLLVLRWGRTNPEAARVAMEVFDRPIAGVVMNRVDYRAHAGRRHGDAIHHIAAHTEYYDGPPRSRGWLGYGRWRRTARRVAGQAAQALHIA